MNINKFNSLDFFSNEIKNKKMELDYDIYRALFQSKMYETDKDILVHYNKNFITGKKKRINQCFTIPYYIDFEFIFKFYGISFNDTIAQSRFFLKYFNHWSIIHYQQILDNYNLGFIYYYYNPKFEYNLNRMYKYCVKNINCITVKNSRELINLKKKITVEDNTESTAYNTEKLITPISELKQNLLCQENDLSCVEINNIINETANKFSNKQIMDDNDSTLIINQEIELEQVNKKKIKSKNKNIFHFIYVVSDDYDTFLNNIRYILKYVNENKQNCKYKIILLIDNKSELYQEIKTLSIENSFYFLIDNLEKMDTWAIYQYVINDIYGSKKVSNKKNILHLFCLNNIFIMDSIDRFINTFLELDDTFIMGYYDYYKASNALYSVSLDFAIVNKSGLEIIKKSKNETDLAKNSRIEKNDDILIYITSFMSIDDFLPLYHKHFHSFKLINKPYLLCQSNSIIIHNEDKIYRKYYNTTENEINNNKIIKLAICIHIGNHNLILNYHPDNHFLGEIRNILMQKSNKQIVAHLYFTIIEKNNLYDECVEKIQQEFSDINASLHFYPVQNKGADIGPFLQLYIEHVMEKYYDYVIKYHTKTDVLWRRELARPFTTNIDKCIVLLDNNQEIGAICSGDFLLNNDMDNNYLMKAFYKYYEFDFSCMSSTNTDSIVNNKTNADTKNFKFVGGTIFMMKKNCLDDFFKKYKINLEREYELLDDNYGEHYLHSEITYSHCWERIISGLVVYSMNKIIFGM